jgi:hypothetical protein
MKSLLAKIAVHKAVGLYVGEHEVAVSKVAATPLGPVEAASSVAPCTANDWAEVAERLLGPLVGRRRRLPVAVGLPGSRLFFSTQPVSAGNTPTPEGVLEKALCLSNIRVDDLTADLLKAAGHKPPVVSVAACRKKYIAGVMAALGRLGVRPCRAEPSPCALVRLASARHRFPRRSKTLLCVFLGAGQGLAVMVFDGLPLCWKDFALPAGGEGHAIISAARTLRVQQLHHGIEAAPEYAIVHGRPDLHERLQQEQFPSDMETRVLWRDGPELDAAAIAFGLALGGLAQNAKTFDLSRSLKARPSLWEIFPWGDLAFTAGLVACAGVFLGAHATKLDDSHASAMAQCSRHKCLSSAEPGRLELDTKDLEKKVEAVRKFLETRILWTNYTADMAARLPAGAVLERLEARCGLDVGSKGSGSKQSFAIGATVPLAGDGSTPREIDAFLNSLRNDPVLQRDFASAELTGIKQAASLDKGRRAATFGIVCLPKAKAAAGPTAKKGAK